MIIMATDPGERNSAFSIVQIKNNKIRLLDTGMITETIVNLTSDERKVTRKAKNAEPPLKEGLKRYRSRMRGLLRKYEPDHFVAERFQTRGVKSRSAETVSMMNGVAIHLADVQGSTFRLIMAASWKNWVNKIYPLDNLYALGKTYGLTNHTVDTLLIALYEYTHFLTEGYVITKDRLITLVKGAARKFVKTFGVRSKVRVLWNDGKLYAAVVEKITGNSAVVRWYEDNSTSRVPLSSLVSWN